MPKSVTADARLAQLSFHDVRSDDGTHIRAWTNDPDGRIEGPTVVLCNGLGTNPYMWPGLLDPDCKVRVVSWFHRGVGGSERPVDPSAVEIEHFVDDGVSVMDHFDIDRAVLMGWSMGVNTMFELTVRYPERVTGLFAVAGVPGDTFATMLAPLRLPHPVARLVTVNLARAMRVAGIALSPIARNLPIGPKAVAVLSHSGFMLPVADPDITAVGVKEFLTTPIGWYMHLALSTSRHARVSLSKVTVPALFVAAKWDLLAGARDMRSAAERMQDAGYVELDGSHFVPLEHPEVLQQLLVDFVEQVG